MARIRSIKPEFFTDEDVAELAPLVRLLFVGMWTQADKAGRLKDKPKTLKARCVPFDNVNVDKALEELVEGGFIIRYEADGERFLQIRTWDEHQRPHHTEKDSTYPAVTTPLNNGSLTVKEPLENGEKKVTRNREPSLPFLSFPFPSSLSEGFRPVWESWVKHRREIKKPLTEEQVKRQLKTFGEWGEARARGAINHTIEKGWQGIREPDATESGNKQPRDRSDVGRYQG